MLYIVYMQLQYKASNLVHNNLYQGLQSNFCPTRYITAVSFICWCKQIKPLTLKKVRLFVGIECYATFSFQCSQLFLWSFQWQLIVTLWSYLHHSISTALSVLLTSATLLTLDSKKRNTTNITFCCCFVWCLSGANLCHFAIQCNHICHCDECACQEDSQKVCRQRSSKSKDSCYCA